MLKVSVRGWTFFMPGARPEHILRGVKFLERKIRGMKYYCQNLRGGEIFLPISPYIFDFADKFCPIFPMLGHVVLIKIKRRQYCIPFLAKTVCFRPICYHDQKENHMLCLI